MCAADVHALLYALYTHLGQHNGEKMTRIVSHPQMWPARIELQRIRSIRKQNVPVINQSGFYCQKKKRHNSVADGQLSGCPS